MDAVYVGFTDVNFFGGLELASFTDTHDHDTAEAVNISQQNIQNTVRSRIGTCRPRRLGKDWKGDTVLASGPNLSMKHHPSSSAVPVGVDTRLEF